jgi:Flp pilus assembly protein TadB
MCADAGLRCFQRLKALVTHTVDAMRETVAQCWPARPQGSQMIGDHQHNANNALGACLVSAIFAVKVAVYESVTPSPATPYVFALLFATACVALVMHVRLKRKAKEQTVVQAPAASQGEGHAD